MGGVVLAIPHRVPLGPLSALVFVAVAVAVALLAIRRPAFGVAALLALDPFAWAHDVGPTQITLGKAALLGVVAALIVRRASLAALRAPATRPLAFGALAIVAATALSAIPGVYIDATAREVLKALEYALAFGIATVATSQESNDDTIGFAIVASAGAVCALALAQLVTGAPAGVVMHGHIIPRIAGPLEGPNQLAGFLDLIIPIALVFALDVPRLRNLARAVLVVAVATDVLTLSRAGLLGAVVGIACVLVLRGRRVALSWRFVVAGGVVVAGLAACATAFGFAGRFFDVGEVSHENGLGTRSQLWAAAVNLWKTDPALGIGAGNYELVLPRVGLVGIRTHANSLYLQSLAEGGIALAAAVVWTIASALTLCLRGAARSPLLLAIGAGTLAFAVHQIFDDLLFFPKVGEYWWLLLGVAAGTSAPVTAPASVSATQ